MHLAQHARVEGAKARTLISSKLNEFQEDLENSDLFDDEPGMRGVMIPKTLVDTGSTH